MNGAWGDVREASEVGLSIATIWADVEELQARAEANARLIAASPLLLKACRFALLAGESGNWIGSDGIEELRDVIAKATGGAQ